MCEGRIRSQQSHSHSHSHIQINESGNTNTNNNVNNNGNNSKATTISSTNDNNIYKPSTNNIYKHVIRSRSVDNRDIRQQQHNNNNNLNNNEPMSPTIPLYRFKGSSIGTRPRPKNSVLNNSDNICNGDVSLPPESESLLTRKPIYKQTSPES